MSRCFPFCVFLFGFKMFFKKAFILHIGYSALDRKLKYCLKHPPPPKTKKQKTQTNSAILPGKDGDLLRSPSSLVQAVEVPGPALDRNA